MTMPVLYAVTVDTEEEWQWRHGWPTGRPRVTNIRCLPEFQDCCECYGAAVTYFANYAVWDNSESRDILKRLSSRPGVEIGMHIHPWNTPPILDAQDVRASESYITNLPDYLAYAKLKAVYQKFVTNGLRPTSFRGGRYSSGGVVHRFLYEHGFKADASVVPFTTWNEPGAPDYRDRDLRPVRRSSANSALWEVPLSMGFTRRPFRVWRKLFEIIEKSSLRRLRLIGIAERLNLVRRVWLNFEDPLGHHMITFLKKLRRQAPACVCFTLHSSSLAVGANGLYSRTDDERRRLMQRVEEALQLVSTWEEFEPATISQIAQQLEDQYSACSRN